MPYSVKLSMTIETEIRLTETSDFLKQILFLSSFNSVLLMTPKTLEFGNACTVALLSSNEADDLVCRQRF